MLGLNAFESPRRRKTGVSSRAWLASKLFMGEKFVMKFHVHSTVICLLAGIVLWQSGCGSSGVNQVVVTVSPAADDVIANTTEVFTSTVTGSTNLNSTWSCTYVYTPAPTTSNPNPKTTSAANCTSGMTVNGGSIGTWTTDQTTADNTLSYTAPPLSKFPNPIPTITFTAAAAANTSKKGTAVVTLDTGIRIAVSPTTATAPVGITPAQIVPFSAQLASGPPLNLNWAVMQPVVGSTTQICTDFPSLVSGGTCGSATPNGASCSPSCGSIDANGVYTAPATMPTNTSPVQTTPATSAATAATTVTVVVWESGDIYHYAVATITLVNASTNPITFTGLHPTTIAAGGALQDVWLDAHNLLNTTNIIFTDPTGAQSPIDQTNVFNIPITAAYCTPSASGVTPVVTCDATITTRVRLTAAQLATAGTATITVQDIPNVNGTSSNVSFPINLVYAKPAMVSVVPDSFPQGTPLQLSADGGYYGASGSLVELLFNYNLASSKVSSLAPSRQVTGSIPVPQTQSPGLYPVSVAFDLSGAPSTPTYTTATSNVAVQPTFGSVNNEYFVPQVGTTPQHQISNVFPPNINPQLGGNSQLAFPLPFPPLGTNSNVLPSSLAINSTRGYAVVTEQGSNSVQLINFTGIDPVIPGRAAPVMIGNPVPVGNQPTGIAIDDQIDLTAAGYAGADLGVVVNNQDSTLSLLAITPTSIKVIGSAISLNNLIQQPTGTVNPLPFSVGIDPGTHLALVAFSNATLGFIVYVNPNPVPTGVTPPVCFNSSQTPPCAIASVSLNTNATPQVVMQPDAPLAYVTPGSISAGTGPSSGAGVTSVVNLLLTNNSVAIAPSPNGASCPAGTAIATIVTPTPNGLDPAFPGAVLIQGVTPSYFNGTYNVLSATTYTLTYGLTCPTSGSSTATTGGGGTITFGNPYFTFNTTTTATGAAINPITRTFAFADPNASTLTPQIGFIHSLDQSVTSLTLTLNSCNNITYPCNPNPSGAPETGIRSVAWDPYTNVLVAYDPSETFNLISLINPGGNTSSGLQGPYRIMQAIATGQVGTGTFTPAGASSPVTVYGPMGYDPKTNLVLVANAGSNTLSYLDIDPTTTFKPVSIRDLQVTSGGVPSSQPPLATAPNAPNPLPVAVCDPTNPANPYASCFPQSVTVGQSATMRIFGQGFGSAGACNSGGNVLVRLDALSTGVTCTVVSDTEVDATIAASRLVAPHDFSLDVVVGGVNSNTEEIYAVAIVDLSKTCSSADMPEAVAFDDERRVGLVTNYGCNNVSIINMDSTNAFNYGVPYGSVMSTITVGANPIGIATIPRLGYAVAANNGDSSAAIINIANPLSPSVLSFTSASCTISSGTVNSTNICVGITPTGVAIDQDRALVIVANTGGNSISAIDLTPLLPGSSCTTTPCTPPMQLVATSGPPTAIAIDPNRAEAVVTNIQNSGTSSAVGGLDVISLSSVPPTRSSTASINSLTANPTGIVYDPALTQPCAASAATCSDTPAPALFYVSSTQENAIYSFDPDTSSTTQIPVGVNPYSLGYNYQTATMISINSTSNTSSIIDTVGAGNSVFATRETLGIGSQSQFAVAVDNFTNTAIIADQNNNRVLIIALPR
jgi:DNA-binding beta-propeller fold protein YncE